MVDVVAVVKKKKNLVPLPFPPHLVTTISCPS